MGHLSGADNAERQSDSDSDLSSHPCYRYVVPLTPLHNKMCGGMAPGSRSPLFLGSKVASGEPVPYLRPTYGLLTTAEHVKGPKATVPSHHPSKP